MYNDLTCRIKIPQYTDVARPTFVWWNSTDPDLDTVSYELQIAPSGNWNSENTILVTSIAQGSGLYTSYDLTQDVIADIMYEWRVRSYDGYEYSEWSDTLPFLYPVNTTILSDVHAKVRVLVLGERNLAAKTRVVSPDASGLAATVNLTCQASGVLSGTIRIPTRVDLGATIDLTSNPETYKNLGGTVLIPATSHLGGQITIYSHHDLGAKIGIFARHDLSGKIKLVTYSYTNFLARVGIFSIHDLPSTIHIIPYRNFAGRLTVTHELAAKVNIPPGSELKAKMTLDWTPQRLDGKITVERRGTQDLYAFAELGTVKRDLHGSVNVTSEWQNIGGKVLVFKKTTSSTNAKVTVTLGDQRLWGYLTIGDYSVSNLHGTILTTSSEQWIKAKVTVDRYTTSPLNGSIDTIANLPSGVYPSGYAVPSGFPPLPSEWLDGDIAVPPSGTEAIAQNVWQNEEEILFVWQPPIDWGYGASSYGYLVAWNDDENYVVDDSDQYVPDNYIKKSWYDSGSMWFHIRAKNSYGHFGPQHSYNIKINHLPQPPSGYLYIDYIGNETGTNLGGSPIFIWGHGYDSDQTDTLSYCLQVYPSGNHDTALFDISGIPPYLAGSWTEYVIPGGIVPSGHWEWRVRAYDTKQYGEWSAWQSLIVVPGTSSLGGKLRIVTPWLTNFKASVNIIPYKDLAAQLNIFGYSNLGGHVRIPLWGDIGGKVYVPPHSDVGGNIHITASGHYDLGGKISPRYFSDLGASIEITNYRNLGAKATITYENQRLDGTVNVCRSAWESLGAKFNLVGLIKGKLTVEVPASGNLFAKVNVGYPAASGISGRLNIFGYSNLDALIGIFAVRDFRATVDVAEDVPNAVVVTSDVTEGVWQENNNPTFYWDDPGDSFYSIREYYVAWNNDPNYVVSEDDQRVNANEISKYAFDAGAWYFHIRAVNTLGHWSIETTHYAILYNHLPTAPSGAYLVEGLNDPTINTVTPAFNWGNANDADQLDVLTYHLQIASNISFSEETLVRDIHDIPEIPNSSRTTYVLPVNIKLTDDIQYFWRVRTYDGKQYSGFSETHLFVVVPAIQNLSAKITIPRYTFRNFGATINIKGYKDLGGEVTLHGDAVSNLRASVKVTYYTDADFEAKVRIFTRVDFHALVTIKPYKDLHARVRVYDVPGSKDLGSKVNVCTKTSHDLSAYATVYHKATADLGGYIKLPKNLDFPAKLVVYDTDHYGFIEEFGRNFAGRITVSRPSHHDLYARINSIGDKPSAVVISANVEEATWQEGSEITFTWSEATYNFFPPDAYYTKIDQNQDTVIDATCQNTIGFERIVDLEDIGGAGKYYFHVAAINTIHRWGPTSHYEVRYNHLPVAVTLPMLVNSLDSYGATPTVTRNSQIVFTWGQSYDIDELDALTYTIQIATQEDFLLDTYGNSSIVYTVSSIPTFSYTLSGGTLGSRVYYWRVKSFDGHQYSTVWSPVGSFRVNYPPQVPTNLSVYKA